MEKVPEETKEPEFRLFQPGTDLVEIEYKRKHVALPEKRTKVGEAFQEVFELVGGVPRLALYADENYGDFLRHYSKMIPRDVDMKHSGTINIVPALPPSPLDETEVIDVTPEK
jgi:hypothetical protein